MKSVSRLRNPGSYFDRSFLALEAFLQSSVTLSQNEIMAMSRTIDFAALSQDCLQKAATNVRIPKGIVISSTVELCKTLRSKIDSCRREAAEYEQQCLGL
eukprot:m.56397 g.56397  ORF g.56397 m.56397 type:complete len:100 (+) comp34593_c0_seq1:1040-1339(+)